MGGSYVTIATKEAAKKKRLSKKNPTEGSGGTYACAPSGKVFYGGRCGVLVRGRFFIHGGEQTPKCTFKNTEGNLVGAVGMAIFLPRGRGVAYRSGRGLRVAKKR